MPCNWHPHHPPLEQQRINRRLQQSLRAQEAWRRRRLLLWKAEDDEKWAKSAFYTIGEAAFLLSAYRLKTFEQGGFENLVIEESVDADVDRGTGLKARVRGEGYPGENWSAEEIERKDEEFYGLDERKQQSLREKWFGGRGARGVATKMRRSVIRILYKEGKNIDEVEATLHISKRLYFRVFSHTEGLLPSIPKEFAEMPNFTLEIDESRSIRASNPLSTFPEDVPVEVEYPPPPEGARRPWSKRSRPKEEVFLVRIPQKHTKEWYGLYVS